MADPVAIVITPPEPVQVVAGLFGPQGPPGPPGTAAAQVFHQSTQATTWTFTHNLGRLPLVMVYDAAGNLRPLVPISATSTTVTAVFLTPMTGTLEVL